MGICAFINKGKSPKHYRHPFNDAQVFKSNPKDLVCNKLGHPKLIKILVNATRTKDLSIIKGRNCVQYSPPMKGNIRKRDPKKYCILACIEIDICAFINEEKSL
jgi:hypothetical protein